ncbi:hypothetical protein [Muribaculum intestinale]|uniref:Terminase n=2 Tax=Muribaculum intestinale TaxID=1796646 RepID=A0A4S1ZK84_9BACT|nr:hypothetical protein [Muribaculum intestinale]TGX83777.1 hypothetical protein E5360_07540 [Muribaculum intestinale]TGY76709.1 hypothetical protein E5333_00180 [Muribaculum intestinale]
MTLTNPLAKPTYFNRPQLMAQLVAARTTVIVAGRRTGKTDSIAAPYALKMMQRMPGSTGGIVVPTFKHGLTNTLPALFAAWARWGYKRDVHYVVGRRPPKDFSRPIIEPQQWENVIAFYNGSVAVMISQDRAGSSNGLTLSWLLIDEAKFIDPVALHNETFPANGGIKTHFSRHSFNHAMLIISDMPQSKKGSWFLEYEKEMNPEIIRAIEAGVYEQWRQKQKILDMRKRGIEPPAYLRGHLRRLDANINKLRSVATYYREYSSVENVQLLGEQYLRDMKRDLTPLTFQTSIMCQKIGIARDGFYSSMKEDHKYNDSDFEYLDTIGFDFQPQALDCRADRDLDRNRPLCIGMDYNANINWIVTGQPDERLGRLNILKSFFVKYERKIPALVAEFCQYYAHHKCKTVVFYYDTTALGSNYAVNSVDFRYTIISEFQKHGWYVVSIPLGNPMRHDEKYNLINRGFAGLNRLTPYFNRQNNDDLILAIQSAGVSRGRNGFQKDKSGEKLAETEDDRLELRTDGTDAFDTLYIGCENRPYSGVATLDTSGVL